MLNSCLSNLLAGSLWQLPTTCPVLNSVYTHAVPKVTNKKRDWRKKAADFVKFWLIFVKHASGVIKAKILLLILVNIGSGKGLLVKQATNTMGYRHRVVEYAKGVNVGGQLGLL